ncbi:CAP domain-containing protein [Spongiactinospora rosea]|uniref:CAP domain-containing protein n=1 Tax=Spongiactinospora rosea TaxID=2248750 RepID=UPI0013147756|nr:CAP domain-containing protein [Spongiactinospora rosea]
MACLVSVLITGIVIGRVSRGAEEPEPVFLNNVEPATPTVLAQPRADRSRAPLGAVLRPSPSAPHARRTHAPLPRSTSSALSDYVPVPQDAVGAQATDGTDVGGGLREQPRIAPTALYGSLRAMESQAVRLTNRARRKHGCRPLRLDQRLMRSARQHSIEMAKSGQFTHNSPNGSSPWRRMERAGYKDGGAENIGRGYLGAKEAMQSWMGSPSHRANILNCRMVAIGVGVAEGPGGLWWTQDFGYS